MARAVDLIRPRIQATEPQNVVFSVGTQIVSVAGRGKLWPTAPNWTLAGHVRSIAHMLTQLQGHQLPAWIEAATAADLPSLQRFAQHLERGSVSSEPRALP
ncbi:hypothetical protein OG542_00850 [Streptomyces violaceus]|uniref:hypothetical protein n=1 Tax=Streptomyces TaxID=1883 RepID=UPI002E1C7524